jgi:hypothetical protein
MATEELNKEACKILETLNQGLGMVKNASQTVIELGMHDDWYHITPTTTVNMRREVAFSFATIFAEKMFMLSKTELDSRYLSLIMDISHEKIVKAYEIVSLREEVIPQMIDDGEFSWVKIPNTLFEEVMTRLHQLGEVELEELKRVSWFVETVNEHIRQEHTTTIPLEVNYEFALATIQTAYDDLVDRNQLTKRMSNEVFLRRLLKEVVKDA